MLRRFVCIFVFALPAAYAEDRVAKVLDGDTLIVSNGEVRKTLRLANIDAPEKDQEFGDKATEKLTQLCNGKDVNYRTVDIDKYGRTVADVVCNGVDVNREMVRLGLAWVYTKYNRDPSLVEVEQASKAAKEGLWGALTFQTPPWEWRQEKKIQAESKTKEVVTGKSANDTCYTGPRGGRYRIVNGHKRYGC